MRRALTEMPPSSTTRPASAQERWAEVGGYRIEAEIGRGGMGVVYRAHDLATERVVALKVLPSLAGLDGDAVERFRQEAGAAGRLSHPGIVPVYATGEENGVHYFAMELVDGPSLAHVLDELAGRKPAELQLSILVESGR
jgi:serine/threonine protein kinase